MPIQFLIQPGDPYFVSKYTGQLTDEELLDSYKAFNEGEEWSPELNEFVDLSEADLSRLTAEGVRRLAEYAGGVFARLGVVSCRTAIYAPGDLPFGLSRMYQAFSEASPESVQVFRELAPAKEWVAELRLDRGGR